MARTSHQHDGTLLCGTTLTPEDRKVWQQAIAMLIGLRVRNGFAKADLANAVRAALHRRSQAGVKRKQCTCEDCGLKVPRGAADSTEGAYLST